MAPDDPRHGSHAGYRKHIKDGEDPCDECTDAAARYERHRRYEFETNRPRMVSARGYARRLHALQALGWSLSQIAAETDGEQSRDNIWKKGNLCEQVSARSHEQMAGLFDRLSMRLPPGSPGQIERVKRTAAANGWAPPLAWDDIDLDDEPVVAADSCVDDVAIELVLQGDRSVVLSAAEKRTATALWVGRGGSLAELARRTGWRPDRYLDQDAA